MMNLWAFLFLGFLAQTSNGFIQLSFSIMEKMLGDAVTEIIMKLKGRILPDIEVKHECLLDSKVTAKNVNIEDVTASSVRAECRNDGKVSVSAAGSVTVGSDSFSKAVFSFDIYMEISSSIKNGHYHCVWETGSFSLSVELSNSFSCKKCSFLMNENEVKKSYQESCQLLIEGIAVGAIHTAMTFMNNQHVKFTEVFKYNGLNCHNEIDHYELYDRSLVTYTNMYCDNKGQMNGAKPFALNTMKPNESLIFCMDETFLDSMLATVPIYYEKPVNIAETNGAFSQGASDPRLTFTSKSPPKSSITTEGARAKISLSGSMEDYFNDERYEFEGLLFIDNVFTFTDGSVQPSIKETKMSSLTTNDPAKNDTLKRLEPLILKHVTELAKEIIYELGKIKVPDPMGVPAKDAKCSNQKEHVCCVQE